MDRRLRLLAAVSGLVILSVGLNSCSTSSPATEAAAASAARAQTTYKPAFGPTRTTMTPPGEAPPQTDLGTVEAPPELLPVDPPLVSEIPSTVCSNSDLRAAATTIVNPSMQGEQDLISLRSATRCKLNGYPTIAFADPATFVTVTDGGAVVGRTEAPHDVAVGPTQPVSFVIQIPQDVTGTCPSSATMTVGTPKSNPDVAVSLALVQQYQTGWIPCGSVAGSAFEQGDNPAQYIN
jgi:hypothetical protein